jgi:hypothetical protein
MRAGFDKGFFRSAVHGAIFLLAGFAGNQVHSDDAVRCNGKLMGAGQARMEVLKYCGEPQDRLSFLDERITHTRMSVMQRGTTQFTRSTGYYVDTSRDAVSSTNVSTTSTTTGGGHDSKNNTTVTTGTTTLTQNHTHDENRVMQSVEEQTVSNYVTLSTFWECKKNTVQVDEFVYNFGAGKFLTFVRFENGRVKDIKYGEYGF